MKKNTAIARTVGLPQHSKASKENVQRLKIFLSNETKNRQNTT